MDHAAVGGRERATEAELREGSDLLAEYLRGGFPTPGAAAPHSVATDRIEAEADIDIGRRDFMRGKQVRDMLAHVARLQSDLKFDADACVEVNAVECAREGFLCRWQAVAARAVGTGENQRQAGCAVFEIVQGLRVSGRCVRMIHALHDLPRARRRARRNGGNIAGALIDRLDAQAVIGFARQLLERRAFQDALGQLAPVVASGGRELSRERQIVGCRGHSAS